MESTEIKSELIMSYKTKNRKVSRSDEGLTCHHIDEDKAIMLSNPDYAIKNPFKSMKNDLRYMLLINPERLSRGRDGKIVDKVYSALVPGTER